MSSGFVSGGTTENPTERDDDWLKAQQEIEANRRRKEEETRQEGGKTLYEVLQSNKAAKQDAFEESIRLKNQFRNLDEDEVEFLDSVLESTRKREAEVKKQTSEQLDHFRQQQEKADKAALEGGDEAREADRAKGAEDEQKWAVNKGKRKRLEEKKVLKGFKLRKASSSAHDGQGSVVNTEDTTSTKQNSIMSPTTTSPAVTLPSKAVESHVLTPTSTSPKPVVTGLGLAGYSSDEED